jgi:hypothetical protein
MSGSKSNVVVRVIDPIASKINQSETNEERVLELNYSEPPGEGRLGSIQARDREISIEYPVDESIELLHHRHLTVQFGERARDNTNEAIIGDSEQLEEVFTRSVINLASWGLEAENATFADLSVPTRHATALLLHDAWRLGSFPELVKLLNELEEVTTDIGYSSVPSRTTVWRAASQLEEAGEREIITAAAKRVVHAIARNGVPLPTIVREGYGLDLSPALDESEIAEPTRQKAIKNWIESILPRLLEPLDFNRKGSPKYSVANIVATLAQAAFASGTAAGSRTATWYYSADEIPTTSQIINLINELDYTKILQIFTEINLEFIRLASDIGFFQTPTDVGIDTTYLEWGGSAEKHESANKLISNPKECDTGQGWCITALGVAESQCRFVLGTDLAIRKYEFSDRFRYLLRKAVQEMDVRRIYADREFDSGDAVEMCRAIAGDKWVIRTRDNKDGEIAEIIDKIEEGQMDFEPNVSFSDVEPGPNLYIHPIPKERRGPKRRDHMYFLTDLGDSESWPTDIYQLYMKRWNIETYFRQIKHRFFPTSETPSDDVRFFLFNIATLFYNIHTLINRAPSPKYGLRLDAKFDEVLLGIVDSVFTRSGDPTTTSLPA